MISDLQQSAGASDMHRCVVPSESVQQLAAPVSVCMPDSDHGV